MTERRDALTELMQQHVGTHLGDGRLTVVEFTRRAVDPDSGYSPSSGLVGKIIRGEGYKITPELVSAIAVGLGVPREVVGVAAHFQLIGYDEVELQGESQVRLVRLLDPAARPPGRPGVEDAPKARSIARRWAEEDAADDSTDQ